MIRAILAFLIVFTGGISLGANQTITPLSELPQNFQPPSPESEFDKSLITQIKQAGWYNLHIGKETDAPPFSFTIGHFHQRNHPEIIVIGLPHQVANQLLNVAAVKINGANEKIVPYKKYTDFTEQLSVSFVPVDVEHYGEYLGYANWYYGSLTNPYPALQMVWPDKQGKLPWEAGYDARYFKLQPILGPSPNK